MIETHRQMLGGRELLIELDEELAAGDGVRDIPRCHGETRAFENLLCRSQCRPAQRDGCPVINRDEVIGVEVEALERCEVKAPVVFDWSAQRKTNLLLPVGRLTAV